ncbi:peptidase S49 [Afipia carboxidovorans OM5]|uniref:Putative phage head-tail preconnector protein n=1 Tax=Afipia carboxidovorans (strain ATCC 49405 / DSM 1227 / KCTC 32145 / OM5) TaxID=504832 RepID=B6JEE6_AFIC5|nr:S49 family peptidase [Afipia carboxidovorans]ACI92711.1 peptidase S49 [Afipia carboxidovorans OM5]AEI03537.1 putative phage head-tail preconnector protein [Afipia carboxidovorans OM4]AEI07114.1 putative phage head-tail preconnector protein [Afipia carboxidovorans OM5]
MNDLVMIADLVLNRPLLVTPDKAEVILSVLAGRIGVNVPEASRFVGDDTQYDENGRPVLGDWGEKKRKPYSVTKEGVGIITITGSLVNRGAWIGAKSGLTSYEGIQHQLKSARDDAAVKSIILDIHSPGGEAVGAFETAAIVREVASKKKVVAVVNGMAASAAYAIPSGATEIVTTETGVSGSIGVVLLHADFSRKLDHDGITPTLIHAGAHKVDGNSLEPLTDAVKSDLQAEVDAFYETFLATVAKGRGGRLSVAAARKTEARTFIGKAAVDAGLADRVGSFESVLAELSRAGARNLVHERKTSMDTNEQPAADAPKGISKADHDTAVKTARAEGVKSERERFKAVMGSENYKGREKSAHHMLMNTDLSAEAIDGALAGLDVAQPAAVAPQGDRSKDAIGGLVTVGADGAKPEGTAASWDKSVERMNARVS